MIIKYDIDISDTAIKNNIQRITNQIFKLLPMREEGGDWVAPLRTLIFDLKGMSALMEDQTDLFLLLCKMEGLFSLADEEDFLEFRKVIFECLGIMGRIQKCLE